MGQEEYVHREVSRWSFIDIRYLPTQRALDLQWNHLQSFVDGLRISPGPANQANQSIQ
jgi:hypothetical protein